MPNKNIPRRVVVKFRDAVNLPYEDGAERHVVRLGVGPWTELAQRFQGVRLNRLFTVISPERIGQLVSRATDRDRHYRAPNLLSFFVIDTPAGVDPKALAAALREWPQIEEADRKSTRLNSSHLPYTTLFRSSWRSGSRVSASIASSR